MTKIFTALTYLACVLGLVSLAWAISIMVGSDAATWSGIDGLRLVTRVLLVWLIWMVILLLPLLIAAWIAHLSRASPLLALAPMLLMAWVLASINGLELMPWHTVNPRRPHGMGFNFELAVLGIFNLWPPTLVCLALWAAVKRWLRRRAALAGGSSAWPADMASTAAVVILVFLFIHVTSSVARSDPFVEPSALLRPRFWLVIAIGAAVVWGLWRHARWAWWIGLAGAAWELFYFAKHFVFTPSDAVFMLPSASGLMALLQGVVVTLLLHKNSRNSCLR